MYKKQTIILLLLMSLLVATVFASCDRIDSGDLDSPYSSDTKDVASETDTDKPTESDSSSEDASEQEPTKESLPIPTREEISARYESEYPSEWGEAMEGIISILPTDDKVVSITLDACGWGAGSGYDEALIEYLIDENIAATLFISGKWIEDNPGQIEYFASFDNFEIENHGYLHKPLSVNGREQYGITGTSSAAEVYDEIENNAQRIGELTGRRPLFFRTGTAYYDDVAIKIAADLGQNIAGYTIAADGGATFSAAQILQVCSNPENGAILLFHMNHPESETAAGIKAVYEDLSSKGYSFVKMEDYLSADSYN